MYYSIDNSIRLALRPIKDSGFNLSKVADYPGAMPVLVEADKQKGVRFDELSFGDDEIVYLNQNVVILRGAALELVHRAFHSDEGSLSREETRQSKLSFAEFLRALHLRALQVVYACGKIINMAHKRKGLTRRS